MKNIKIELVKFLMVFSTIIILTGCSKDDLTRMPQGSIADPTQLSASNADNFFYNIHRNFIDISNEYMRDEWSDDAYARNPWQGPGTAIQNGSVNSGTEAQSALLYPNFYKWIRDCNVFLVNLDKLPIPDATRTSYRAETRVVRAWHYLTLTLMYGDVPLITETNFSDKIVAPPVTKKEEVRAYILSELKDAIGIIPANNPFGRLTKYSAEAIYARALYYSGKYAEAEAAAKDVIDNGPYKLQTTIVVNDQMAAERAWLKANMITDPSVVDKDKFIDGIFTYESIWRYQNNCPEVIIQKEFSTDISAAFGELIWRNYANTTKPDFITRGWATNVPWQAMVDAYWSVDGKTIPTPLANRSSLFLAADAKIKSLMLAANNGLGKNITYQDVLNNPALASQVDFTFLNDFKNKDSRFYATIIYPLCFMNQWRPNYYFQSQVSISNESVTDYLFAKYTPIPKDIFGGTNSWGFSGNSFPVIRLAEIMLIWAESHTQTTGYDGSVETMLNKLRARCGMPNVPSGLAKNAALDFVRHERRLELAGEGSRFYDIRLYEDDARNGGYKGKEAASVTMNLGAIKCLSGTTNATMKWTPNLLWLPYPQSAVDANPQLVAAQTAKGY